MKALPVHQTGEVSPVYERAGADSDDWDHIPVRLVSLSHGPDGRKQEAMVCVVLSILLVLTLPPDPT